MLSKWDCQSGKISAGAWSLPAPKTEFTETFQYFALLNKKIGDIDVIDKTIPKGNLPCPRGTLGYEP